GLVLLSLGLAFALNEGWIRSGLEDRLGGVGQLYVATLSGWLAYAIGRLRSRWRYRGVRDEVLGAARRAGFSVNGLIAALAQESRFDELLAQLCRDRVLEQDAR
ncbi:MAG: hypothetical protein KDC38_13885, partial [Planctomycetes bacterium]|nr:hypothetical protein [Planctomycetota bacterium]